MTYYISLYFRSRAYFLFRTFVLCLLCLGMASPGFAEADLQAPALAPPSAQLPVSDGLALMRQGVDGDMCVLTFDDGPSQHTSKLLDTLRVYGVPATFFVIGSQVKRRPELIRRMIAEGHEVGNHSYSHNELRKMSPEEQQEDLLKLDTLLRELGAKPRFVRPPYGFYDHNTINIVQGMNGHIVMWSVDSQDWRNKQKLDGILSNMQTLYTGAPLCGVFLFHDTHRKTVETMPLILDVLQATGCRFVTLSEYIDTPKTKVKSGVAESASDPHKDAASTTPSTEKMETAEAGQTPSPNESQTRSADAMSPAPPKSSSRIMSWILERMNILPERNNGLPH